MGRVISLHRGCLGDVSSGRVVGVSTWCITHGRHTRVNTSVGTVYVFWYFFLYIKSIRIMISKIYIYIYYERTLVVPDVVLARWRSGNVFDRPWCFSYRKWKKIHIFIVTDFLILKLILLNCFTYSLYWFLIKLLLYLSTTEHMVAHTPTISFFQASYRPSVYSLRWSRSSFSRCSLVR